jgi:serine protease
MAVGGAGAAAADASGSVGAATPHLPAAAPGHAYRHGVVPPRAAASQTNSGTAPTKNLAFGGDVSGVGVTTGPPQVYLVFWGSQWKTQGTNANGDVTLSGDPSGMAPYLQEFIKGLGSGGERWSGVMTQYCQGVSAGATTCPSSNTQHVGYPTGGALAGVWVDESSAAPQQATGHQLGVEAVNAAAHFGNTTSAGNRNAQYVVVSPTGTNPDGFNTPSGQFCAWHDYTGDSFLSGGAVSSPYGELAFTNLPYVTDMGASCGQNFVNSGASGLLDGVSIVEGHEYAETVTDQFPAGGWTDSSGNENGDKCAWISSGQGAAQDITLTTGSFAVQSTWANDFNSGAGGCEISHPIVTDPSGNTVTVTNPGNQTTTEGVSISPLQMTAQDSASGQTFTWSATNLPPGLTINSSTGAISGTPTATGTKSVTVTATDTTNASGSTTFSWTISARSTSTGVSCSPSSPHVGNATTCTATVTDTQTGTATTPTGTVTFAASPTDVGSFNSTTCALSGTGTTGVASCHASYTPSATGSPSINASYGGDSAHVTSTTATGSGLTVATRSTSTGVSCSPATLGTGGSTTCTATVTDTDTGTATTPSGTVAFSASPTGHGSFTQTTCTLSGTGATGVASCQDTYTPSAGGAQAVSADYAGDSTHASSNSSGSQLSVSPPSTSFGSSGSSGSSGSGLSGSSAPSGSSSSGVPTAPGGTRCPAATGRLSGSTLGAVKLGMTRKQVRSAYTRSRLATKRYQDFFCLALGGVRVGYPPPALLTGLAQRKRRTLAGRAVWATTANPRYSAAGIRPGEALASARQARSRARVFTLGRITWYLLGGKQATVLVEVQGGVVREVGIADNRLTQTAKARLMLVRRLA